MKRKVNAAESVKKKKKETEYQNDKKWKESCDG
jgi:hypothetical protein